MQPGDASSIAGESLVLNERDQSTDALDHDSMAPAERRPDPRHAIEP
jgi:hypothetical protein